MNTLLLQLQLDIETNVGYITDTTGITGPIIKAITKYEKHPSIKKINEALTITDKLKFSPVLCDDGQKIVSALDVSETTAYCSIPINIFKQNFDIDSGIITDIYVSPVHKKNDYTDKTSQFIFCLQYLKFLNVQ